MRYTKPLEEILQEILDFAEFGFDEYEVVDKIKSIIIRNQESPSGWITRKLPYLHTIAESESFHAPMLWSIEVEEYKRLFNRDLDHDLNMHDQ